MRCVVLPYKHKQVVFVWHRSSIHNEYCDNGNKHVGYVIQRVYTYQMTRCVDEL